MERVRVLLVADEPGVRSGLSALLSRESSLRIVGEAPARREALLETLGTTPADVVLLDATHSHPEALSTALSALIRVGPHPALVALGEQPSHEVPALTEANWLPGWGYFLRHKGDGSAPLAAALRAAALGTVVLDRHLRLGGAVRTETLGPAPDLTQREREVLALLALGLPNKQIASRLGVTPHTAKFHVAQILQKLEAESRTEAVTLAARRGWLSL
ncbi:MAG: response regulator transcription factor [Armatimonas sp.]